MVTKVRYSGIFLSVVVFVAALLVYSNVSGHQSIESGQSYVAKYQSPLYIGYTKENNIYSSHLEILTTPAGYFHTSFLLHATDLVVEAYASHQYATIVFYRAILQTSLWAKLFPFHTLF